MKKMWMMVLAGAFAAGLVRAEEPPRVFALATAGDVEFELAERIRNYLEEYTGAAVRFTEPVDLAEDGNLEVTGRAAAETLKDDEFGIVVLARPTTDQPQGICLPHERFGILNLTRLGQDVEEDRLVRRAGQDGLRVMSMLVGMSPCPFPLCVLTYFNQTEDLDMMSGNFCPPCQDRFTRLAREEGILLIDREARAAAAVAAGPVEAGAPEDPDAPPAEAIPMPEPEPAAP